MVKVTTDLCLILSVVACLSRVFDFSNMGMFCNVGRELNGHTISLNIWDDALHHLELWDEPIINGLVSLANTSFGINDG